MKKNRVTRNPGYSVGAYRGHAYVRTQRSAQFRWVLMGVGIATLGTAGSLAYNTFTNEYQQARSLAETAVVAGEVGGYKPSIEQALAEADALADQIGNEVSDPATVRTHNALRRQARTLLAVDVVVPVTDDGAKVAYIDRDVADSMLAVDAAMVPNLAKAQEKLRASHEAYQELVDAKAEAAAAVARLNEQIPVWDNVLFETAPSVDGWIYVPEDLRIVLADAIQAAKVAGTELQNKELSSVADFKAVAEHCQAAAAKASEAADVVNANIKLPAPVIPLDEFGNPIEAPAPTE